jgi:hypothetical protein
MLSANVTLTLWFQNTESKNDINYTQIVERLNECSKYENIQNLMEYEDARLLGLLRFEQTKKKKYIF